MEVDKVKVGHKFGHNMESHAPIRRSSRKKEDKSYVEIPDSMIELTDSRGHNNGPSSCKDGGFSQNMSGGGATGLSNGDVEMESEESDDEDLPLLPLPKVGKLKIKIILRHQRVYKLFEGSYEDQSKILEDIF